MLGGPALYLVGHTLFKRAIFGIVPLSRFVALVVLLALLPAGLVLPNVAISAAATLVLWGVAGWEAWAYRDYVHGPEPAAESEAI